MIKYIFPVTTFVVAATVLLFNNCTPTLDPPKPTAGSCNFSTVVAVGGDFMAGYQDGALSYDNQDKCLSMLLTRQTAQIKPYSFLCNPHRVPADIDGLGWNLKPWESWFTTSAHLGFHTDCLGVNSLMPASDSLSRTTANSVIGNPDLSEPYNLAVPFATLQQQFDPNFTTYNPGTNSNPFGKIISNHQGVNSIMDEAQTRSATFFMAWLGMEDIYNYAQQGGAGVSITPSSTFSTYLDSALSRLTANGAKGVIANIPDFRNFPFYTLVPWNGASLTQNKADSLNLIYQSGGIYNILFHEGNNAFVIDDPALSPPYRQLGNGEYILLDVPLDSMKCDFYGLLVNTINNRYVLDSAEVANIDAAIASYNAIIAQKAQQYDLALVDMNSYFRRVQSGIKWDGVAFNTEFVTGGFFSLDGYHPNQKGYALITNEFISAINGKYGSTIPTLDCFDCNGILFP